MRKGILLMVLAIGILTGCSKDEDWTEFRSTAGTGFTTNALAPPLGVKWKLDLQEDFDGDRNFNPPILRDGTLYFGSADGNFYALDIETGFMRWVAQTSAPINSIPYVDDQQVCLGSTDGYIYSVDAESGQGLWQFFAAGRVNSTIRRYEDMLIATGDNRSIVFLDLEGNLLEEFPNPVWSYHSYLLHEGMIFFMPGPSTENYNMGVYDIENDEFLWFLPRTGHPAWFSFPMVVGDVVYYSIGSYVDGMMELSFHADDRYTGEKLWIRNDLTDYGENTYDVFAEYCMLLDFMAPALYRNFVIYSCGDPVLRAFDKDTGEDAWRVTFDQPVSSAPIIAGSRLYIGVSGDDFGTPSRLVCLDARNGRELWSMETEGDLLSAPVIAGKWMVFGTSENKMYILEEVF